MRQQSVDIQYYNVKVHFDITAHCVLGHEGFNLNEIAMFSDTVMWILN